MMTDSKGFMFFDDEQDKAKVFACMQFIIKHFNDEQAQVDFAFDVPDEYESIEDFERFVDGLSKEDLTYYIGSFYSVVKRYLRGV